MIKIDKNSWHARFLVFLHGAGYMHHAKFTICSYVSSLISGALSLLFAIAVLIVISAGLGFLVTGFILATMTWANFGSWALTGNDITALLIAFLFTLVVVVLAFAELVKIFSNKVRVSEDNFYKAAYSSWKNKWCMPVKIS